MQNLSNEVSVRRYGPEDRELWNRFVLGAKNSHFMFLRDFMEYHEDRFDDHSLLFFRAGQPIGLLPANANGDTLYSHQGLTYGSVLASEDMTALLMQAVFDGLKTHMQSHGLRTAVLKPLPYVFHRIPAQEDLFALGWNKARIVRRDLSSVLDLGAGLRYTKGKKSNLSKARRNGVVVRASEDYATFHQLLATVLQERHGVAPVHSAAEMAMLARRLPDHLKLYGAFQGAEMIAGSWVFDNGSVVHTQYLANSPLGREVGALDLLIDWLAKGEYAERRYLSFGISTEQGGTVVNQGLLESKEAFGARTVVHDWYEMTVE